MAETTSIFQLKTYQDALDFVDNLDVSVQKLGLSRIANLLKHLSNPQDQIATIHVAGTNGKGSTVAMLSCILKEAGYKVGQFTSPHLRHVRERIAINGNPILPEDFLQQTRFLKEVLDKTTPDKNDWPTYFEFLTAMGFEYFKSQQVDIALIEVGLGGRLDSTNVIKHPNLTIITHIGLDHTAHLGNTLADIAREKAGILKPQTPLVLGPNLSSEAQETIETIAKEQSVIVTLADTHPLSRASKSSIEEGLVIIDSQHQLEYHLPLSGGYSLNNLATVLKAVETLRQQQFDISNEALQKGLAKTHWPARFEHIAQHNLILDGSHNPDGLHQLDQDVSTYLSNTPLSVLVSLKSNKEADALIQFLTKHQKAIQSIIFTGSPDEHFHDPDDLKTAFLHATSTSNATSNKTSDMTLSVSPCVKTALTQLKDSLKAHPQTKGLITGSLYTAGTVLDHLE